MVKIGLASDSSIGPELMTAQHSFHVLFVLIAVSIF